MSDLTEECMVEKCLEKIIGFEPVKWVTGSENNKLDCCPEDEPDGFCREPCYLFLSLSFEGPIR